MAKVTGAFEPDWVCPPGDTIVDALQERGWTEAGFAKKSGFPPGQVNQLITGEEAITEPVAEILARVLGFNKRFWLAREARYRSEIKRLYKSEDLEKWIPWLDRFPILEMMNNGLLPKRRQTAKSKPVIVKDLLLFFSATSPAVWEQEYTQLDASFRRANSDKHENLGAISAWLRAGEKAIERKGFTPEEYSAAKFKAALREIRCLTQKRPGAFGAKMTKLCHESGVNLVLIPSIPRARVSGVARWLDPNTPSIQLSLYGKTNDRFWFTFFHEAAHILLHRDKAVFIDGEESSASPKRSQKEREADDFAANLLIPKKHLPQLRKLPHTKAAVRAFSRSIGIHPGIVVGRLQHEKLLPYQSALNSLKASFEFRKPR